jgi:hypothetical protein
VPQDPPRRAPTHGGEDRHRRRSDSAGAPIAFVDDEITGRYEGVELDEKRRERDERTRERLAVLEVRAQDADKLKKDVQTQGKLVDHLNITHEIAVKPVIEKLPGQLDLIRAAQVNLDAAVNAAIASTERALAEMARQLQDHNVRISDGERKTEAVAARLSTVETAQREDRAQIAKQRSDIVALKRSRGTDVVVGSFVRRHAVKVLLVLAGLVGSAIAGYVSAKLGVKP